MRRLALFLTAVAFLGMALASGWQVARAAPAYNKSLRVNGILGDWRVPISRALYDNGAYRFQIGYGFLQGDSLALLLGKEDLPDAEIFRSQVDRAKVHLGESLNSAPGRVDAWTTLAWARFLAGDRDGAKAALRISWSLAPRNFGEAHDRLALVEALGSRGAAYWWQDQNAIRSVANDLDALTRFDRRYFKQVLDEVPGFRRIAQQANLLQALP